MHVVTAEMDKGSGNHWYKIVVDLPEIHMETPNIHTVAYGNDLIDMICKIDDVCPHCDKKI